MDTVLHGQNAIANKRTNKKMVLRLNYSKISLNKKKPRQIAFDTLWANVVSFRWAFCFTKTFFFLFFLWIIEGSTKNHTWSIKRAFTSNYRTFLLLFLSTSHLLNALTNHYTKLFFYHNQITKWSSVVVVVFIRRHCAMRFVRIILNGMQWMHFIINTLVTCYANSEINFQLIFHLLNGASHLNFWSNYNKSLGERKASNFI